MQRGAIIGLCQNPLSERIHDEAVVAVVIRDAAAEMWLHTDFLFS